MKEQIYTKFHQYERPDEGYDQKPTIYSQDNVHYVIPTTYKIPEGFGQEFESHKEFDTTDAVQIYKALQDKGFRAKKGFSSREEAEQFISSGNQDYLIEDDRSIKPVTINQKVLDEISKMADKKDITNPEDRLRFTANTLAAFYNEDNPLKPLLDVDKFIKNKSYYTDKENPVSGTDSIKLTELMTRLVVDKEGRPPSGGDFGIAFARRFIPGTVSTAAAYNTAKTVGSFIPDPRLRTMLSIVGGMGAAVASQAAVESFQDPFLPKDTLNIQNAQFRELINNRDFASLLSDSATSTLLTGYLRNQGIKLNLNTAAFLAKTAEASEKTGGKKYVILDAIQKLFNNSVHQSSNLKEGAVGLGEAFAGSVLTGLTGDDADSFSAILGQLMGGAVTEKTFAAGSIGNSIFNALKNPAKRVYYGTRSKIGSFYDQGTADKYAAKLEELKKDDQGILNEKYQRDVAGKLRENLIGLIPENRPDPETNELIPLSFDEKMQVLDGFLQELGELDVLDQKRINQLGLKVTEDRDLTRLDTQLMSNPLFKSLLVNIQGYIISQQKRMDEKGSRKATQNQVNALKHLVEQMVVSGDPEHTQRLVDLHATAVEHDITKRIVDSTTALVESYDRVKGLDRVKADGSSGTTDPFKGLHGKVVDIIDKLRAEVRDTENKLYKKIENSEKLAISTFYDDKGNKLDRPPFLDKYLKERESLKARTFKKTRDEDLSKISAIDDAIVKELASYYDEESPDVVNLAKLTNLRKSITAKLRDLQDTNEQELKHILIKLDNNILQDLDNLSKFSKQDETLGDDIKNAIADYDVARSYTRGFYAAFGKIFDSKEVIGTKFYDSPEIAMKNFAKETDLSSLQIDKLYDLNRLLRASTTEFFGKDDLYELAGGAGNQRLSGLNVGEESDISAASLGTLASNLMELERFRILNNIQPKIDIDDSGKIISTDKLLGNLNNENFTQKQLRKVLDRADRIEKEQPELYSELQSFLGAAKTFQNENENFKKIQQQVRDQKIFFDLLSPNFEKNTQIFKSFRVTEKPLEVINKVVNGSTPFVDLNQILKIIDNPQLNADNAVNFEELNKSARNGFKRLLLEEAALASGITGTANNDFLPSKMLYKLYAPLVQTLDEKKSKTSLMEWMIDNKLIDEQESDNLKAALGEMSRVDRIIADERYSANEQFDAVNKNSMAHLYVSMMGANIMASSNRVVSSLIPGFGNSNDASLQMASEGARKARETFNMFLEIPEQKKFDVLMDLVKMENFDTFKAMMLKTDDPDMVRKKTRKIANFLMESAFIPATLRRAAMQQAYLKNEAAEASSDYLGIEALPETSRIYPSNQPETSIGEDVVNLIKVFFGRGSGGRSLKDNVQRKIKGGSQRGILIGNILNKAFDKLGLRSYRKRPEDLKSSLKDQSKIRNLVLEEARKDFENIEGSKQIRDRNRQKAAKGMNLFEANNPNPVNQNTNQTLTPEQKEAFKKDLGIVSLTM